MANFTNFATDRPNYFPGQYLLEDDFELQHKYLADRQIYHNKSLHISGIIEGLEVEVTSDSKGVLIKSGSAINNQGQLIVLKEDTTKDSSFFDSPNIRDLTNGELFIKFVEEKQVKQQENVPDSYTRWREEPFLDFAATTPDPDKCVKLAILTIDRSTGVITVNDTIREYSGLSLPNSGSNALTLRSGGNTNPNLAVLTGSLKIEENLFVEGTETSKFAGSLAVTKQLQIIDTNQDANGQTLSLGPSGLLRLGYNQNYRWIQSHGSKPLAINPLGNNVGIGTTDPGEYKLNVQGDQCISGNLTVNGVMRINQEGYNFSGFHSDQPYRMQQILSSEYSDLIIASSQYNPNGHGSTLTFATSDPNNPEDYRKWVFNQGNWNQGDWEDRKHMLEIGYKDAAEKNPHRCINDDETVMTLNGKTKCIGIGTRNPSRGKVDIIGTGIGFRRPRYRYFNLNKALTEEESLSPLSYSLYAEKTIGAAEFRAISDMRIKEVKGVSDSQSDLKALLQISITDYVYKDKIANDRRPHKKVIGQQVAEVFPQAVNTHTDVVPDIFQPASIANGWVNLDAHGLQVGERVQLLLEESEPKIYTIEAVNPESFRVSLDYEGKVFVYGREVNDFHVVDYDALAMLNISATQELYKIIDALKIEVQQLKAQLNGSHRPTAAISNS